MMGKKRDDRQDVEAVLARFGPGKGWQVMGREVGGKR